MSSIPEDVQTFLSLHPDFIVTDRGKVKCAVTNHEMPARLPLLEQHLKGNRYRMKKKYTHDFSKYAPYIVPSEPKNKVYCVVTRQILNKVPEEVEAHLNSRKFKLKLEEWKKHQEKKQKKTQKTMGEGANHINTNSDDDGDKFDSDFGESDGNGDSDGDGDSDGNGDSDGDSDGSVGDIHKHDGNIQKNDQKETKPNGIVQKNHQKEIKPKLEEKKNSVNKKIITNITPPKEKENQLTQKNQKKDKKEKKRPRTQIFMGNLEKEEGDDFEIVPEGVQEKKKRKK